MSLFSPLAPEKHRITVDGFWQSGRQTGCSGNFPGIRHAQRDILQPGRADRRAATKGAWDMGKYITVSGQTWDQVACEVYGDDHYCDRLMDANRGLLEYFVFPAGVVLDVPDKNSLVRIRVPEGYPDWRAALDG